MTLSRSNCDLYDLFMNQMSFTIVNNTICPDWYLNLGPLDLQSNTLPLCQGGCWHLVLITLVGLFNDSFAISRTAYLLVTALILVYNRGSHYTSQVNLLKTIPVHKSMHDDLVETNFTAEQKLRDDLFELHPIKTNAAIHPATIVGNNARETAVSRLSISEKRTTVLNNSIESLRLVYIKTRETGSSTMTNILYRLALRHNLTVMTFFA